MLVFAMTAHEYAHAATALHEGDDTAYTLGRVTLNPIPHIDPWMSLLLPTLLWFGSDGRFTFGGAKPVPVNSRKYRKYRRGDILVSSAGVIVNFFLALLFSLVFVLLGLGSLAAPAAAAVLETAQRMMLHGIWLNLILCFFNLIPLPPLDGSGVIQGLFPTTAGRLFDSLAGNPMLSLLGLLVAWRIFGYLFRPAWSALLILLHPGVSYS